MTTAIETLFQQALLAQAAYADLSSNPTEAQFLAELTSPKPADMTSTQAENFVADYEILDRKTDADGLSVTLFKKRGGTETFVAIRGTNDGLDFLTDYLDVALLGSTKYQHQYASLKTYVQQWLSTGQLSSGLNIS